MREARHLTQAGLAKEAGVSATHVYQIERGLRKSMHLETLRGYARAFGVSAEYLETGFEQARSDDDTWIDLHTVLAARIGLTEEQVQLATHFIRALVDQQTLERMLELGSTSRRQT